MQSETEQRVMIIVTIIALLALCCAWPVQSYFEARAYNHATGKNVSTWDAMWIELRVTGEGK